MAAYEDSYKSQLQGVSQQVPRERLDGQVSEQINMLSDAVTNIRRRPGTQYSFSVNVGSADQPFAYVMWETVVGSTKCQVLIDSKKGVVRVLDMAGALLFTSAELPYLQTTASTVSADLADAKYIHHAAVGGEVFLANTLKVPALGVANTTPSSRRGFIWIVAGAFNTTYTASAHWSGFGAGASYTTPDGSAPGDAAVSTPAYIAAQLATQLSVFTLVTSSVGDCIFIEAVSDIELRTESSLSYVVTSAKGTVRREEELPRSGPITMADYLIAVGGNSGKRYYRYNLATSEWLESGDTSSPLTLTNTPISITNTGGVWAIDSAVFEGRLAGDDDTNPVPEFVASGITGMSAYQGRLVLMAGGLVYLSGTNLPRRFFRSTVTTLLDNDPIGVGSTGTTAASFTHAVQYNNDLVLFSERNQAILPGSTVAATPRTAALLPTSEYSTDVTMRPVEVGRGLLYAMQRSENHHGLMEMLPSDATEHLYVSSDITQHLPTYMAGVCRLAVSSSVSSLAVFGNTGETDTLLVFEYTWAGGQRVQQAWHKWVLPFPVATAYFSAGNVVVVMKIGNYLVGCQMSPHGSRVRGSNLAPFLDLFAFTTVTDNIVSMPAWFTSAVTADEDRERVMLTAATGDLAGERVQMTYDAGVFTTGPSFPSGTVAFGLPYTSSVTPTPPMRKDYNGVKVSTNKMTLLRYNVGTNKSGEFAVSISDNVPGEDYGDVSPLLFNSPELELGAPMIGADNTVVVPARTRAENTELTMSVDGVSEFNLVGLEFVAQYHEKLQRARG